MHLRYIDKSVVDVVVALLEVKRRLAANSEAGHLRQAALAVARRLLPKQSGNVTHPLAAHVTGTGAQHERRARRAFTKPQLESIA